MAVLTLQVSERVPRPDGMHDWIKAPYGVEVVGNARIIRERSEVHAFQSGLGSLAVRRRDLLF